MQEAAVSSHGVHGNGKNETSKSRRWRNLGGDAIFLLPALVLFTLFTIYPVLRGVYYSLTNWDGITQTPNFVGLQNFQALLHDDHFLQSIRVTLIYAICVTLLQNIIALLLALSLQRFLRFSGALRVLFLLPTLLSGLAIGYIWSYLYAPGFGFIDTFLATIGLGSLGQDWLGNFYLALPSVIATGIWRGVGGTIIIYMAGLQIIPQELHEAVTIDGANNSQRFRYLIFPLLAPAVTINFVLIMISSLSVFDTIFAMTNGGPFGATRSVTIEIYNQTFSYSEFGYGTALSLVVFFVVLALSVVSLYFLRKREVTY